MPIKSRIRTVPHYPKQGVMFRDITTLLKDPVGFRSTIDELVTRYAGVKIDKVAGIESRGFIVGSALAFHRGAFNVLPGKQCMRPWRGHGWDRRRDEPFDTETMFDRRTATRSPCPHARAVTAEGQSQALSRSSS
jgi:hypothetical protein